MIVAAVLWSLGLFAGGLVLGHRIRKADPTPTADVIITVQPSPLDDLQPAAAPTVRMPNVLGLTNDEARAVLSDAGLDAVTITVAEVPRAGLVGVVSAQDPDPGVEAPAQITLSVSTVATMPDLTGLSQAAAEQALIDLGARPTVTRVYVPDATPDTVLNTSPAAGELLPDLVSINLAARPASLFLYEIDPVEMDCRKGIAKANGVESEQAHSCRLTGIGTTVLMAWDISRKADRLTAQLGMNDDNPVNVTARVEIVVDGAVRGRYEIAFGSLVDVDIPLTGGLRLEVRVTTTTESPDSADLVLLDAAILADEDSINFLSTES